MSFQIINKIDKILNNKSSLLNGFYNKDTIRYILGINECTDKLLLYCREKDLIINGIIDDYTCKKVYSNLPIIKMKDVKERDAIIISCVIDGKLITAINNLKSRGMHNILSYLELGLVEDKLKNVHYCSGNVCDVENNKEKYNWIYENLTDDASKDILESIIDFRYNYNIAAMEVFKYDLSKQYFDEFIKFKDGEVFIDCGGFAGETTKKFIDLCPKYKSVYYFEPEIENFKKSQQILKQYKNINYFNKGTYKDKKILSFSNKGSESSIDESGDERIEVIKLDDVIDDEVSYIKMDVEGSEYESLVGSERLIKAYKPKLAICVYHKQEDFWRIPELVLSYNKNYKIYLRHYTEGILETVMYFVP